MVIEYSDLFATTPGSDGVKPVYVNDGLPEEAVRVEASAGNVTLSASTDVTIATSSTPAAGRLMYVTDVWFGANANLGAGGYWHLTDGTKDLILSTNNVSEGQAGYIHFKHAVTFAVATAVILKCNHTSGSSHNGSGGFAGFIV